MCSHTTYFNTKNVIFIPLATYHQFLCCMLPDTQSYDIGPQQHNSRTLRALFLQSESIAPVVRKQCSSCSKAMLQLFKSIALQGIEYCSCSS